MISKEFDGRYPRILIVSNNPFSKVNNNGKTLASFFDNYPVNNIAQLYFHPQLPDNTHYLNYFRITDNDVVKRALKKSQSCGSDVSSSDFQNKNLQDNHVGLLGIIKKSNAGRILREIFWSTEKWKTEQLNQWLEDFSPEVIFFCAGDSGFAYEVTNYIKDKFNSKTVVYITDDYILPRQNVSPFYWLRRNYILKKMRDTISKSDLFVTISKEMKEIYKKIFNKESILAVNMTDSLRDESVITEDSERFNLIYTGGLHFNRYKTLNLLAQALKRYNADPKNLKKAYLKIYSSQRVSDRVLKYLNVESASEFCGGLNSKEVGKVLNLCDIPVHVESFDKKSMESTKLSLSTKIPEYLSLGKCILAIGPENIASMKYLKDISLCINSRKEIDIKLHELFNNSKLRSKLSKDALTIYEKNHKKEIVREQLISSILKAYRDNWHS